MAKNDKLLKVLNGNFPGKSPREINAALDALIKADPNTASEFRKALIDESVFWTSLDPSLAPIEDKDDYLLSGGEGAHSLENNLIALRQKAAHQRVLRGLQSAKMDVLNEIAKEEDKQKVRDFIKDNSPLLWQVGWGDLTADQLTDDSVTAIRAEAKEKLKQALMEEISTDDDLENLNNGYKDPDDYESDTPKDWVAESDKAALKAAIKDQALFVAKQRLENHKEQSELAALLKAADFDKFIDEIKKIDAIGEHVDWITEDDIGFLKDSARAALASQISEAIEDIDDASHLQALIKAAKPENISSYQKTLASIPVLSDAAFLNEKNFAAVLPAIRKKAFELQVEKSSPYGKVAHQELIQAFNGASADKQAAIARELEKNVLRLLHARDENDVKRMLGGDGSAAAAENRRLEKFKKIKNAEAAKLLANLFSEKVKPPVDLSDDAIDQFNSYFSANDGAQYNNPCANEGEYCQLIKDVFTAIRAQLPAVITEKDFYNKFGVSDDGSAVSVQNIKDGVLDQRNFNLALLVDAANDPAHASFIAKFMSVKKTGSLDAGNVNALWQCFDKSKSFQEFKTKVSTDANLPGKLDANWSQQFTAADFMKLKAEGIKELKTTKEIRNHINAQLDALWKSFPATKFMGGTRERVLRKLAESDVETWFDPAFMERSKHHAEVMKPKFEALAHECDVIIREMTLHKESLESLKENLPDHSDSFPETKRDSFLIILDKNITELNEAIAVYKEARNKLMNQVLPNMEEAIKGGKVVQGFRANTGVKVTVVKRGDESYETMDKVGDFHLAESERSSLSSGDSGKIPWAADKMEADEARFFDVTSKGEKTTFGARFKEERGEALKPAAVYANDKRQQSAIKLTVVHSPLSAAGKSSTKEEAEAAKINFAMVMASQMLAELDGPPDKKHPIVIRGSNAEELKYLWTALKVLQEELKDTKMNFKDDAIQVKSLYFRPETQKGRVSWSSDSLYKTVFQKEANVAIWKGRANDLSQLVKDKYAHDQRKASAMGVISRLFKNEIKELTKTRKEQEEELREGPGLSSS